MQPRHTDEKKSVNIILPGDVIYGTCHVSGKSHMMGLRPKRPWRFRLSELRHLQAFSVFRPFFHYLPFLFINGSDQPRIYHLKVPPAPVSRFTINQNV
jgi:hypothetical protein